MAETIAFLVERGIPVMAHVGLTPQSINAFGGFRAQGRDRPMGGRSRRTRARSPRPARSPWCSRRSPSRWPRRITRDDADPDHRHRRQPACDGQILVLEDMLGLSPRVPKFVKRYGDLGPAIDRAVAAYAAEVRERRFPAAEQRVRDARRKPVRARTCWIIGAKVFDA